MARENPLLAVVYPSCCPICGCRGLGKAKTKDFDGEKFAVRTCRYCGFEDEEALDAAEDSLSAPQLNSEG